MPHRQYLGCLLLVILAIATVGCSRDGQPTASPTPPVVAQGNAQNSALVTPTAQQAMAAAQPEAESPLAPPTATPVAILVVATPTALPHPEYFYEDGQSIVTTPIPAAAQVVCLSPGEVPGEATGEVTECYDELLDMEFSYPAFMGPIRYTQLRPGGYAGFGYEYIFEERESYAGGRSRDFSEGRGPRYTDQRGFEGRSLEEICAIGWNAAFCQQLGPGATLSVLLPEAEWLCTDAMFIPIPRAILSLDLPQHPLINGFAFSFELLSTEDAAAFKEEWYNEERHCKPETKEELRLAMEQLGQDLQAGSAADALQLRYNAIIQMVESIQSPYVSGEDSAGSDAPQPTEMASGGMPTITPTSAP